MVWATKGIYDSFGNKIQVVTKLVPVDELQRACKDALGLLDSLTPQERKRVHETGEVPEAETVQINRSVRRVGIVLARPK